MKKIFLFCSLFFFSAASKAQINNPVQWSFTAVKIADKQYEIHLTATIGDRWHLYAQDAGEGPVPTSIQFTANPLLVKEGKVKEVGSLEKAYDNNFNSTLKFYTKKVDFVQKVRIKSAAGTLVKGTITFMVCNDRQCLPPKDVPFSIKVGGK